MEIDLVQYNKQKEEKKIKEAQEEPYARELAPGGEIKGLRDREIKEIDLNRILYQMVISLNPIQTATVLYNDVIDEFLYRIYRPKDGSVYEKILTSENVTLN